MEHNQLGATIDALYNLRQQRLELSREVDALKSQEVAMREQLLAHLQEVGLAKASGNVATIGQIHKTEPLVSDWDATFKFIRDNDRFDLVQKRISAPAWREIVEGGGEVPGIEAVEVFDLSLTKSTRG